MKRFHYSIKNLGGKTGEIAIRGVIGISNKDEEWMGMTFEGEGGTVKEFEQELKALGEIDQLNIYISSEGGLVSDGMAIHTILQRHSAKKTCFIDGYAYSIASVIPMACDEVRMPSNALMMIHNAEHGVHGDYRVMERAAEQSKAHNKAIRNAYAAKSGRDEKEFIGLMDAETYLDGPAAKALGLVDVVTDEVALSNLVCSKRFRDSAHFARQPARFAALFDTPPPPTPSAHSPSKPMTKLITALAALSGISIAENASEDEALAAIQAFKPAAKNIVIDFESDDVKAAFNKRIAEATAADKAKITALEGEITNLKALITNGAASAAGGNPAVSAASKPTSQMTIAEQYAAITDAAERTRFYNKHREELRKPSNLFQAAA